MDYIRIYDSSSSSSESESEFESVPVCSKKERLWKKVNLSESELKNDFRIDFKWESKSFHEVSYYCAKGKRGACPVRVKVKEFRNGSVIMYQSTHGHENHRNAIRGLTGQQKIFVNDCIVKGLDKPTSILHAFRSENIVEPPLALLKNFLAYHRKRILDGVRKKDIGDVIGWCEDNSEKPKNDIDKTFVVNYEFNTEGEQYVRIFISTRRLLSFANRVQHLHADATYKLIWEGFPVLVVGITDRNRSFHPCGMAVTKSETTADYAFLFQSLKDGVENEMNIVYKPTYLVADCALAITNGFTAVFGEDFKRVYCYFHVKQAYQRRLNGKKFKAEIEKDIEFLRLAFSSENFTQASKHFLAKWSSREESSEFITYFETEWLQQRCGWYLGFVERGVPTTNNALESTNRQIKEQFVKRNKSTLGVYLNLAVKMLSSWSSDRKHDAPNCKSVELTVLPKLSQAKQAHGWLQTKPSIVKKAGQNGWYTAYVSHDGKLLTPAQLRKFKSPNHYMDWNSYKKYVEDIHIYRIRFSKEDSVMNFTCTCGNFLREYLCYHVLGIANTHDMYTFPARALTGDLQVKRGPGRPKKMTRALEK